MEDPKKPLMEAQNDTGLLYDQLDHQKKLWIDTSIQSGETNITKLARECATITNESAGTWRKRYYTWRNQLAEFETLWFSLFGKYYKRRMEAKAYAKISQLIEKETDLVKLVKVLEFLEKQGTTQDDNTLMVEIVEAQQKQYGIGEKDDPNQSAKQ